jgi:hypothetical protein
VEYALVVLQIGVPAREQSTQMTREEINPPQDDTDRLIRDWGILFKYRDYLHCWRNLLLRIEKPRKKQKARKRKPEGTW